MSWKQKKILFIIPARGGSKGIPKKNIKLLAGKPLIQYSIDAAREITDDANICVSTDDQEIISVVKSLGLDVPFVRPEEYSGDHATTMSVIQHAVSFYMDKGISYDLVVVLQPTSPLRTGSHIKEALDLYEEGVDLVISVKETDANPYYLLYEEENGYLEKTKKLDGNITRRQAAPMVYELNGAVYVYDVSKVMEIEYQDELPKKRKYLMDKLSSVDIDDYLDWDLCELILSKKN